MAAITSLMRAQQIVLGRLDEVMQPYGLSFARYELISLLSFTSDGELPLGKIGQRLQVHGSSVTGALDKLEEQDLVIRVPDPKDGRGKLARITDLGRKVVAESTDALNAGPLSNLGIEADDAERLIVILRTLRRNAGDF